MPGDGFDAWVHTTFGANPAQTVPGDGLDAKLARLQAVYDRLAQQGVEVKPLAIKIDDLTGKIDTARHQGDPATRGRLLHDLGTILDEQIAGAETDAVAQLRATGAGEAAAIHDLRDAAAKEIAALGQQDADEYDGLHKRLLTLDRHIGALGQIADPAKHRAAQKAVDQEADKLYKNAVDETGNTEAMRAVYKKALLDKYGFTIENPKKTKFTHLEDIYEMFAKVPQDNVAQEALQHLTYTRSSDGGRDAVSSFERETATISMSDHGETPEEADYIDPGSGKKLSPDSFSITALHELGHSLDERWGVMAAHMARSGCGGWQIETVDSTAKALVEDFRAKDGKHLDMAAAVLESFVAEALEDGVTDRPDLIEDDADWELLKPLLKRCLHLRDPEKTKPWKHPHDVGGRTYHQSYKHEWVSADFTARMNKGLMTRAYQWRAPGEFFAELYAFSWFHKKPLGKPIDAAILQYLYQGGGGDHAGG